jgi:hypothetical protein
MIQNQKFPTIKYDEYASCILKFPKKLINFN